MSSEAEPKERDIPKRIFIIPYRNRIQQKFFFEKYMTFLLEDDTNYEIYFSHQADDRSFNRGAVKNIGFLAMKQKYPNHYKDINFIFNDVDTMPFNKIFDYQTTEGVVKHYYGFKFTLGGIVVIKGSDFEKINGYPNFWGWGNEDNCLQTRCIQKKVIIDRSTFYPIGSPQMLQLFDGIARIISKRDTAKRVNDNGIDGLSSIHQLHYTIDKKSKNVDDNVFLVENERIYVINIQTFQCLTSHESQEFYQYDLREPGSSILKPDPRRRTNQTITTTDDWQNIPYYHSKNKNILKQQQQQPPTNYLHRVPRPNAPSAHAYKPRARATASANIRLGGVY